VGSPCRERLPTDPSEDKADAAKQAVQALPDQKMYTIILNDVLFLLLLQ
jgi:hypothetical protein